MTIVQKIGVIIITLSLSLSVAALGYKIDRLEHRAFVDEQIIDLMARKQVKIDNNLSQSVRNLADAGASTSNGR